MTTIGIPMERKTKEGRIALTPYAAAELVAVAGGLLDGHLLSDHRGGTPDHTDRGTLRHPPCSPWHHLPGQPGAWLPHASCGPQLVLGLVPFQDPAHADLPPGHALFSHHGRGRAAHHLRAENDLVGDRQRRWHGITRLL